MTQYFGDFSEDQTVYIPFNTFDSNDPSASVTITNLADADIMVHKDGSATQIVTDGATVAIDFDTITGNHLITIDTSASADYSTGSDYLVRIEGTTVDAATINAWVGSFSIENRHSAGALRPTTAGRTLDVTATGAAGVDWGNVENQSTSVNLSATTTNLCNTITTYTGNTVQTGDSFARLGAPAGASVSADIADVPTVSEFNARTLAAADYFDPAADTVALVTTTTNLTNQSGVIASGTAQAVTATTIQLASGETFADDEIIGSTVLIDTASTGAGQSRVITDYTSSTDTATVDTWTTTPTGTITYEIFATAPSSSTALPDVNMAQISGSATAADNLEASALGIVPGACEGTPTTTVIQTDLAEATDDHYIGRVVVFTSGGAAGQATDITDYTGATGTITVTALTTAPSASDTFVIV